MKCTLDTGIFRCLCFGGIPVNIGAKNGDLPAGQLFKILHLSLIHIFSDEEQENGETKPLSEKEYSELLKEKGKQNLVPTKTKSESQIAVQSTQFQYGVDYFVGDFVTVEHHRFGICLLYTSRCV